jgi:hypothetical protein
VSDQESNQIKTRYRTTFARLDSVEETVCVFEDEHGISVRWKIGSQQFIEGRNNIARRRYQQALNNLERLVVQRLLELTKLNASGLGEYEFINFKIADWQIITQGTNFVTRSPVLSAVEARPSAPH